MKTYLPEHANLANWLREQLREGCARLFLRQRTGDVEQHVREWALDPSLDLDALAEEINGKVFEEGRALRGPTLYALLSQKPGTLSFFDRKLFRIEGMSGSDSLLGETEEADPRGIVSQMMRHNEASARISLGQTLAIVEHYKQILKERDARIAALEEKHMQVMELQERLMSMQHERDVEMIRERRADKKQVFVREKLDMLAPVIMSKVLGAGTPKGQGSILGEEVLRQFLKSLAPPQMAAIMNALNPEQVVAIGEIFERYSDREAERQRAAAAADANDATNRSNGADGGGTSSATEDRTAAPSADPAHEEKKL